jgi:hypothetical protein
LRNKCPPREYNKTMIPVPIYAPHFFVGRSLQ